MKSSGRRATAASTSSAETLKSFTSVRSNFAENSRRASSPRSRTASRMPSTTVLMRSPAITAGRRRISSRSVSLSAPHSITSLKLN